jgi:hypothetical protein
MRVAPCWRRGPLLCLLPVEAVELCGGGNTVGAVAEPASSTAAVGSEAYAHVGETFPLPWGPSRPASA